MASRYFTCLIYFVLDKKTNNTKKEGLYKGFNNIFFTFYLYLLIIIIDMSRIKSINVH